MGRHGAIHCVDDLFSGNPDHTRNLMRTAGFPVAARETVVAELAGKGWFGDNKLSAGRETEGRIDEGDEANDSGGDEQVNE